MQPSRRVGLLSATCILSVIAITLGMVMSLGAAETAMGSNADYPTSITVSLQFPQVQVVESADGTQGLYMEEYPSAREIGLPALPSRVLTLALPPGADASQAVITAEDWNELPGAYNIEWGQEPLCADEFQKEESPPPTQADAEVYSSNAVFPASAVSLVGTGRMRGISLAEVRISPVRYYPLSGRIEVCGSMSIRIDTSPGDIPSQLELAAQPFDETIEEIVFNFDQARSWYEQDMFMESQGLPSSGTGDAADYIIITTEALVPAVEPLKSFKETQGLSVQVTTTQWIEANCTGIDLAEQIRNYLKGNYITLGTDYVLLAGTINSVPMRICYAPTPSNSSGNVYSDYFYCDLSGDWDLNDDGRYGELGVDDQLGGADFFPEVYVGRIPTDDAAEMTAICEKIVAFSLDSGSWKYRALLLGAVNGYLLESPSFLPTYGSNLLEKLKNDILVPLGYQCTTMYETEGLAPDPVPCDLPLSEEGVIAEWPNGYGMVNISAHGSTTSVVRKIWESDNGNGIPESSEMFWSSLLHILDCPSLDDTHPSIVFSNSCSNAKPTSSNNLMASLLKQGASATIGSTQLSYYVPGWQNEYWGGSSSQNYIFWQYFLQDGYRIGKALRMGDVWYRSTNIWLGNYCLANLYDFNLYGDPSMKLDAEGSPSISGVDPQANWNNGQVTVSITGSNFLDGAQARLAMSGQDDIIATSVTVDSSTRISATFDVTAVAVGKWDVVVENPDGQQAVLAQGFEVTPACGTGSSAGLLMFGLSLGILYITGAGGWLKRRRCR